jgi:NADH:ubiquinone oxidoreductase subunit 6 (subunit J)
MTVFAETSMLVSGPWRFVPPLVLAAAAVYILLPRPRARSILWGAVCGVAALALAGFVCFRSDGAIFPETFLFYAFSALAVTGGALMITQPNPARAAICFALVVMNVCGLFLLQAAPFLMAAAIIIYAGAIIVTFLFVLMLAQQRGFSDADDRSREPFLAAFAGFTLLGALLLLLDYSYPPAKPLADLLDRIDVARGRDTAPAILEALGGRKALLDDLRRESRQVPNKAIGEKWAAAVVDLEFEMRGDRTDAASLKEHLAELAAVGRSIQKTKAPRALPAENVAAIGRLLYSDYILAVELGGALLLVATIGAIAIAGRRPRRAAA